MVSGSGREVLSDRYRLAKGTTDRPITFSDPEKTAGEYNSGKEKRNQFTWREKSSLAGGEEVLPQPKARTNPKGKPK